MILSKSELAEIALNAPDTIVKVTRTIVVSGRASAVVRTLGQSAAQIGMPYTPGEYVTITETARVLEKL